MPIDFMTALRSRARAQERSARLTGRPLTSTEASAPYVAMAETAGDRYARGKSIELQEQGQDIQQGQFGESLELERQKQAENTRLEEERLTEQKRAEEARLAEMKRTTDLQVAAAERADERAQTQTYVQTGTAAVSTGIMIYALYAAGYCCFIFVASHGYLHPIVRRYRDNHMTVRNRRGYCWLADRLVPLMARFRAVKWLVDWLMVRPMTCYGKYYFGMNRIGAMWAGLTKAWLTVFDLLGRRPPYRRRGTDEIV